MLDLGEYRPEVFPLKPQPFFFCAAKSSLVSPSKSIFSRTAASRRFPACVS